MFPVLPLRGFTRPLRKKQLTPVLAVALRPRLGDGSVGGRVGAGGRAFPECLWEGPLLPDSTGSAVPPSSLAPWHPAEGRQREGRQGYRRCCLGGQRAVAGLGALPTSETLSLTKQSHSVSSRLTTGRCERERSFSLVHTLLLTAGMNPTGHEPLAF